MLALTVGQTLMAFVFCLICILLILLILIQKGRGGGLSGAFGGVGSYSPFGTKTGDALTWATVILTGMFLLVAVLANYVYKPQKLTELAPDSQPVQVDPGQVPEGEGATTPVTPVTATPVTPGSSATVPPPMGNPVAPPVEAPAPATQP